MPERPCVPPPMLGDGLPRVPQAATVCGVAEFVVWRRPGRAAQNHGATAAHQHVAPAHHDPFEKQTSATSDEVSVSCAPLCFLAGPGGVKYPPLLPSGRKPAPHRDTNHTCARQPPPGQRGTHAPTPRPMHELKPELRRRVRRIRPPPCNLAVGRVPTPTPLRKRHRFCHRMHKRPCVPPPMLGDGLPRVAQAATVGDVPEPLVWADVRGS